jgi:outer membrane biosynthesis protein TonB
MFSPPYEFDTNRKEHKTMKDGISTMFIKGHNLVSTTLMFFVLILAGRTQTHAQAASVKVSALDSSKQITYGPEPSYPLICKREHKKGMVRLQFTVRADGTVSDISDLDNHQQPAQAYGCYDKVLVDSSTEALSLWKYKPYLVGGQPTAMRTTVQFKFDPDADKHIQIIYQ